MMTHANSGSVERSEPAPIARVGSVAGSANNTFSEAQAFAMSWMVREYGRPRDMRAEDREQYHERLGLIIHMLGDMFPSSPNVIGQPRAEKE